MSERSARPRAHGLYRCPTCGRLYTITQTGLIRIHRTENGICAGSGVKPHE